MTTTRWPTPVSAAARVDRVGGEPLAAVDVGALRAHAQGDVSVTAAITTTTNSRRPTTDDVPTRSFLASPRVPTTRLSDDRAPDRSRNDEETGRVAQSKS